MYPFLAQPPQKQKRLPPPPLRSIHPYANISTWASKVQPGSPPPCSPPHRRPSTASSRRRLSHSRAPPSGSFMVPHSQRTPSSATGEYPSPDLTAVGYTSLFVHFDKTPTTPSPFKSRNGNGAGTPLTTDVFGSIPIPAVPPLPQAATTTKPAKRTVVGLARFRSILRPKKSKQQQPTTPSSPVRSPKKNARKAVVESAAIAQRKRAKYAGKKNGSSTNPPPPPPSLANELALMQFIDGGSVDDNVKRLMEKRAKVAGGAGGKAVGVESVYRDRKGGIWYDADEEMEYAHLLGAEEEDDDDEAEWEDQNVNMAADKVEDDFVVVIGPVVKAASPNTNAYCPLDNNAVRRSLTSTRLRRNTSLSTSSSVSPRLSTHTKQALLSLPSRPRRNLRRPSLSKTYAHLCNTPTYLIDIDAFAPRSPNLRARGSSSSSTTPSNIKKHRPRPAPLQLSSSQSAHARANAKVALVALNGKTAAAAKPSTTTASPPLASNKQLTGLSPSSLDRARREFVEDSFQPTTAMNGGGGTKLGVMKGLFVRGRP